MQQQDATNFWANHGSMHGELIDLGTPIGADAGWALSYADLITIMMCFFVISLSFKKADESPKELLESLAVVIGSGSDAAKKPERANKTKAAKVASVEKLKGSSIAAGQNRVDAAKGAAAPPTEAMLAQAMAKLPEITARAEGRALFVDFEQGGLFDKGEYVLSGKGDADVERIAKLLQPFASRLSIEVSGHTDPRPVLQRKGIPFRNNMELAFLRASSVRTSLIDSGLRPQDITLSAAADFKPPSDSSEIKDFSKWRRVTLTIRVIE